MGPSNSLTPLAAQDEQRATHKGLLLGFPTLRERLSCVHTLVQGSGRLTEIGTRPSVTRHLNSRAIRQFLRPLLRGASEHQLLSRQARGQEENRVRPLENAYSNQGIQSHVWRKGQQCNVH